MYLPYCFSIKHILLAQLRHNILPHLLLISQPCEILMRLSFDTSVSPGCCFLLLSLKLHLSFEVASGSDQPIETVLFVLFLLAIAKLLEFLFLKVSFLFRLLILIFLFFFVIFLIFILLFLFSFLIDYVVIILALFAFLWRFLFFFLHPIRLPFYVFSW
jgi:hypothetical protein